MDHVIWIAIIYLILINILTFIAFGVDKSRARNHAWRTSEKRLFFLAVIGGSVGAIAGMYFFRHKTRHWYFVIGMIAILHGDGAIDIGERALEADYLLRMEVGDGDVDWENDPLEDDGDYDNGM